MAIARAITARRLLILIACSAILLVAAKWISSPKVSREDSPPLKKTTDIATNAKSSDTKEATSNKKAKIEKLQSVRHATLKDACPKAEQSLASLGPDEKKTLLRHLIVDEKHKILYCYVPKAACANWKKVIQVMENRYPSFESIKKTNHTNLNFLIDYSPDEINRRLKSYYRFTFVRHPLARLVSAYRNKMLEIKDYQLHYGRKIIQKYRKNFDPKTKGDDVKFTEFVRFLLDSPVAKMNEHWQPFHHLCQPCVVSYDFIGDYESLEDEANYVLEKSGTSVRWPPRQGFYKPTKDDEVTKFYGDVEMALVKRLVEKYQLDFALFGYDPKRYLS